MRYLSLVKPTDIPPLTRHFVGNLDRNGVGPTDLAPMGWPRVLLILRNASGVFLDRLSSEGESVGDTWHQTVEEAKEQAAEEFGELHSPWRVVPEGVPDNALLEFAEGMDEPP